MIGWWRNSTGILYIMGNDRKESLIWQEFTDWIKFELKLANSKVNHKAWLLAMSPKMERNLALFLQWAPCCHLYDRGCVTLQQPEQASPDTAHLVSSLLKSRLCINPGPLQAQLCALPYNLHGDVFILTLLCRTNFSDVNYVWSPPGAFGSSHHGISAAICQQQE